MNHVDSLRIIVTFFSERSRTMKSSFISRAGPKQQEVLTCLDRFIREIRIAQDKLKPNADNGSVDLTTPLILAEELQRQIKTSNRKKVDWELILKCVIWLVEIVEKTHSFFNCIQTSILRYYENWTDYKNYQNYGWCFTKCFGERIRNK